MIFHNYHIPPCCWTRWKKVSEREKRWSSMDRWGKNMQGFHKLVRIDPSAPAAFVILSEIRWQWPFNSLRGKKWNGQIFHPFDLSLSAICLFFSLCWQWLMLPNTLTTQNHEVSPIFAFCSLILIFGTVLRYFIYSSCVMSVVWIATLICHNLTGYFIQLKKKKNPFTLQ